MIWESQYWKEPLLEASSRLRSADEAQWSEGYAAQLERDVLIGFYSIRKLLEVEGKVSDKTRMLKCKLLRFDKVAAAPHVDLWNRTKFSELYDMEHPRKDERNLIHVAHQLVHSFIMFFAVDDRGRTEGVFFCSDRYKEKLLYFIELREIAEVFEAVGNDYPTEIRMKRDSETGAMRIVKAN